MAEGIPRKLSVLRSPDMSGRRMDRSEVEIYPPREDLASQGCREL
jgi:hypothetical protein